MEPTVLQHAITADTATATFNCCGSPIINNISRIVSLPLRKINNCIEKELSIEYIIIQNNIIIIVNRIVDLEEGEFQRHKG